MFICFLKQQLVFARINHVIYLIQSQFLFEKTNEHRTTSRKAPLFENFTVDIKKTYEEKVYFCPYVSISYQDKVPSSPSIKMFKNKLYRSYI